MALKQLGILLLVIVASKLSSAALLHRLRRHLTPMTLGARVKRRKMKPLHISFT